MIKANVEKYLSGEINALVNYGGYSFEDALLLRCSLHPEEEYLYLACTIPELASY